MSPHEIRRRHTSGCLTDCVAFVLRQHPFQVPLFVDQRAGWVQRLKRYFLRHGYRVYWRCCTSVPRRGTHIVCGDSLEYKTFAHAVVYRSGALVYDPQYPSRWRDSRITHRLVCMRINDGGTP